MTDNELKIRETICSALFEYLPEELAAEDVSIFMSILKSPIVTKKMDNQTLARGKGWLEMSKIARLIGERLLLESAKIGNKE